MLNFVQAHRATGKARSLFVLLCISASSLAAPLAKATPSATNPDRPKCDFISTDQEGWYWRDSKELLQLGPCSRFAAPSCDAIGTRSEGWYSEGWISRIGVKNLVIWDNRCHRDVGLSLHGESCGEGPGYQCVERLRCVNNVCITPPPIDQLVLKRQAADQTFDVQSGQKIILQLDRGPVHPCYGGNWLEDALTYDATHLTYLSHEVVANPECPAGLMGCHHEMDQFTFRVDGKFSETQLLAAMKAAPQWCANAGNPTAVFVVTFKLLGDRS